MSYRDSAAGMSQASEQPISEAMAGRLNNLDEQFHRLHNDFRELAERLLGPVPTPVPGLEQGRRAQNSATIGRIEEAINSLEVIATQLRDDYNRLRAI